MAEELDLVDVFLGDATCGVPLKSRAFSLSRYSRSSRPSSSFCAGQQLGEPGAQVARAAGDQDALAAQLLQRRPGGVEQFAALGPYLGGP